MQLALDVMERYQKKSGDFDRFADEITALRQELAKPEQEPTWSTVKHYCDRIVELEAQLAQPRKPWVGLTDKEMLEIWRQHGSYETLFKKVEIKLKDKNT